MFTLIITLINTLFILIIFYWIINHPCEKCGQTRKLGVVLQDFFKPNDKCLKCQKEEQKKSQITL